MDEAQQEKLKEQIKQRRLKIEEIRRSVELSQKNADRETQDGIRVFNILMESVQQSLDSFKRSIEKKHRESEEAAARLVETIQTEISALEQRGAELERRGSSEDQTEPPQLTDWAEEPVRAPSYEGRVAKAVSDLERELYSQMQEIFEAECDKAKQFAVEVTLDPDTAHSNLVLSEDLKQVHYSRSGQDLPENSERFLSYLCVLGKQKFSSGKFYFEVQVRQTTEWAIGLAKESVDRKDDESEQTPETGFWVVHRFNDDYDAQEEEESVVFPVRPAPEKVGVFVDYDEGLVSFFDVGNNFLIYSFSNCCFSESVQPLLNPCNNSRGTNLCPLVLTPVSRFQIPTSSGSGASSCSPTE